MSFDLESNNLGLVRVEIKENPGLDVMMGIEGNHKKDDTIAIILFIIILLSSSLSGYFSPMKYFHHSTPIISGENAQIDVQTIELVPSNNHFSVYLQSNPINAEANFQYSINYKRNNKNIKRRVKKFSGPLVSEKSFLFHENSINFDRAVIHLVFLDHFNFQSANLVYVIQNPLYSYFETWVRCIFCLGSVLTLILYVLRFQYFGLNIVYTIEQKFTLFLIVFSIFHANPFYPFSNYYYTILLNFFDRFLNNTFEGALLFSILIIFHHSQFKNDIFPPSFILPKFFLSIFLFVIGFFIDLFGINDTLNGTFVNLSFISLMIRYLQYFAFFLYIIYFVYLYFTISKKTDSTEQYVTNTYSIVFFIYFFTIIIKFFINANTSINNNCLVLLLEISSRHTVVILLAFLHWPFDSKNDKIYENQTKMVDGGNLLSDTNLISDEDIDLHKSEDLDIHKSEDT